MPAGCWTSSGGLSLGWWIEAQLGTEQRTLVALSIVD